LRDLTVFEYGSGFSTLFWAKRAKKIVSVEHDLEWFNEISSRAPENTEIILASKNVGSYVKTISERGTFDIVVIDGTGESRLACCQLAPKYLNSGGFIILDNSDLWPESAATLRNADLIQVDFTGLAPLSCHWHTTSIFFSRQYSIRPAKGHQPHRSVAQPAKPWPGA
jgi:predicted O-methyltransferase YrrM